MKARSVSRTAFADMYDMGGLKVRQPLPSPVIDYLDPFVLLHHGKMTFESDGEQQGIGAHPHRGFSPVTFLFSGSISHRDSSGNHKVVDAGGTQWMHAGSGILHAEAPIGREVELIQMWVNSPSRHKLDEPLYTPLMRDETPAIITDEGARINVVAGGIDETAGPVPTLSPMTAATLEIPAGATVRLPAPAEWNAFLYLLDGAVEIADGTTATGHTMIVFDGDGDGIELRASERTRALFMSGKPIGEEIVTRGPFVMNSDEEIRAAYRDFVAGKMGEIV